MSDWHRSDRTTCPQCGSPNYKELSLAQRRSLNFLAGLVLFSILFTAGLIFPPLFLLVLLLGVPALFWGLTQLAFGKPPKQRQCLDCHRIWDYYWSPEEKETEVSDSH